MSGIVTATISSAIAPLLLTRAQDAVRSSRLGLWYDEIRNPDQLHETAQRILKESLNQMADDLADYGDPNQWKELIEHPENRAQMIQWIMGPSEDIEPDLGEWSLENAPNPDILRGILQRLHQIIQERKRRLFSPEYFNAREERKATHDTVKSALEKLEEIHAATVSPSPPQMGKCGERIDAAVKLIDEGQRDVAEDRLTQIERDWQGSLTNHELYRIYEGRGHISRHREKYTEAQQWFYKAYEQVPETEEGQWAKVFSTRLSGDRAAAAKQAEEFRESSPNSKKALMEWFMSCTGELSLEEIVEQVPASLQDDNDILLNLACTAATKQLWTEAEAYTRRILSELPDSPMAIRLLGTILIHSNIGLLLTKGSAAKAPDQQDRLREGIDSLKKLLEGNLEKVPTYEHEQARLDLATAYGVLNKEEDATEILQQGCALLPNSSRLRTQMASHWLDLGEPEKVVALFDSQKMNASEECLVLAIALALRNQEGDFQQAIQLLNLSEQDAEAMEQDQDCFPYFRARWVRQLLSMHLMANTGEGLENTLDGPMGKWLDPIEAQLFRAEAAYQAKDLETAWSHIESFVGNTEATDQQTADFRHRLAKLLFNLGRYSDALSYLQELADPHAIDNYSDALMDCATRANRNDVVLEFCAALRENNIWERRYFSAELQILSEISPNQTLELLQEIIAAPIAEETRRIYQAVLSQWALMMNREDLVDVSPDHLPSIDEIEDPGLGALIVEILRQTDQGARCLQLAYELFRRFPNDPSTNASLFYALMTSNVELNSPEKVTTGTAVEFRREDTGENQWVVIENVEPIYPNLNEISVDNALSQAMMGKAVGDSFQWRDVPKSNAIIMAIMDRRVYQAKRCGNQFETSFPGTHTIMKLQTPTKEDGTPDIDAFLQQIEGISAHQTRIEELYCQGKAPLHALGLRGNTQSAFTSPLIAVEHGDLGIHCCYGNPEEFRSAFAHLAAASEVVLDSTALGALHSLQYAMDLDVDRFFSTIPYKLLLSEHTVHDFQLALKRARDGNSVSVTVRRGKAAVHVADEDGIAKTIELLEALEESITKHCTIINGVDLASTDFSDGTTEAGLKGLLGLTGFHALHLAKQPGRMLWSDDLFMAIAASSLSNTGRVWTQVFMWWLLERDCLADDVECAVTLALSELGYTFTALRRDQILWAGEKCRWDADAYELQALRNNLRKSTATAESQVFLIGHVLKHVWQDSKLSIRRGSITDWFLDTLATAPNGGTIIKGIRDNTTTWFGPIDVITSDRFQNCIDTWVVGGNRIIIP